MPLRLAAACALLLTLLAAPAAAQGLPGALIGTVRDQQGGAIRGAEARVSSDALIGGPQLQLTNEKGQFRFPSLPPGAFTLEVSFPGFAARREEGILVAPGATIERSSVLQPAGVAEAVVVDGGASRIDARDPGFGTRFGPEDLRAIPSRRASMFDALRNAPGISPTSPSSGTTTTISAFGSGTNENQFLIDGTNTTCPCNGIARSEPGVDFIQEIQVQSVGASAEFGNVQGAVINVITRQGSERFAYDASYYGQPSGLTAQPVTLQYDNGRRESGYERALYRDFTTNLGGPAIRSRLWFFGGYQYLRDYDSQPAADPVTPRKYEQNKVFAKLTWSFGPAWRVEQTFHEEFWQNPDQPRFDRPIETTTRLHARVPAATYAHVTHTVSPRTLWDARVGRFDYLAKQPPYTGDRTTPNRLNDVTNVQSGGPSNFGDLTLIRTVGKATLNHYRASLWRADHAFKVGAQLERGEHHSAQVIPTGVRYRDNNNGPSAATYAQPSKTGAAFLTLGLFATDAISVGDRATVNLGLRYDRNRAFSQDLPRVDLNGTPTDEIVPGLGTLYVWHVLSPRLGITMKLDRSGRTMLRASYGRFAQGVLTGELSGFHPGLTPTITKAFVPADGEYTRIVQLIDRSSLVLNRDMRAPRTDEYGAGIDREIAPRLQVAVAYVRKSGAHYIGWQDIGGVYQLRTHRLADGRTLDVYERQNAAADQRFLLTNPPGWSMTYNGLVTAVEKRRANGWQAFGSYTLSRSSGLQAGSGGTAAGQQVSTVAPPPATGLPFGRDPNDLTNARGILPNDRPHILRAMGAVDVPRTGFVLAANLQHFTGKPWAASAQVATPQSPSLRILLEPRGTRRLSSQTLLDLRVSRRVALGPGRSVELLVDVLNALNESAEESIVTDVQTSATVKLNPTFGRPNTFVDPRRVMLGVRLNLGKP